jgi:hypothetical protein
MSHSKSELLYSELAEKLNEIIPVVWDKIYFRSEVEIGAVELTYWFIDSRTKEIVQNFDMSSKYGIDRKSEKIAFSEMTYIIENLHKTLNEEGNQPFTVFTFILDNEGRFKVKYDYINLEESTVLERREAWVKEYLHG